MKVKIFEGFISKYNYNRGDEFNSNEISKIESAMNSFMVGKTVVDIKVNTYTIKRHNNGGYDSIKIVYTVMYKD